MPDTKAWVRPYWHVDAKWFFGILFSICLFVSLLTFTLARLTSKELAVPIATYIVATQFSREGLDSTKDIDEAKAKFLKSGEKVYHPLPDQKVTVTKQELETLSPKALRLTIFEQVVEPIYTTPRTDESMKQLGFMAFLNFETHNLINQIALVSLIPLTITAIGLIAFSYKTGKIISPAISLVFVSTLPAIALFFIQKVSRVDNVFKNTAASLSQIFYLCFTLGIALLITSFILRKVLK